MRTKLIVLAVALALVAAPLAGGLLGPEEAIVLNQTRLMPHPPDGHYSAWRTAPITVALVFGRAAWTACSDADPELVEITAEAAIRAGLDPAIAAATVAVESSCNTLALSGKAVGLMQIRPSVWSSTYNFSKVNLLNRTDNIRVGTEIMASLIEKYGTIAGVQRYNGLGTSCETCDAGYSSKILSLAHR